MTEGKRERGRPAKYPWRMMQVGEWIFVPDKYPSNLNHTVRYWEQVSGYTFRMETRDEHGEWIEDADGRQGTRITRET